MSDDAPVPPPQSRPVRVLLVDDQPIVHGAVKRMVAGQADIELISCLDARQALAMAQQHQPTVILQDLQMPDIDGLTLVTEYRADPVTRDIPLVVLSVTEEASVKVEAFARGANDYLVKLPHALELLARVRYHSAAFLAGRERQQALRQLELRNALIRETFGRYLSDEVVASILESPEGVSLGGARRHVTVLMSDLRGFSSLAESLAPEDVVSVLNDYLQVMTEVIMDFGGTIDEIIGDGILVLFGAPVSRPDDARRGLRCALAMQLAMREVTERQLARGLPRLEMGIGLATGDAVVGNIGSTRRLKYSIVGNTVVLTSRIESCTVGGQVLCSEATLAEAGTGVRVDGTMDVELKGLRGTLRLYDIGGVEGEGETALSLPTHDAELTPLAARLDVRVAVLEGKQSANWFDGQLLALSAREALLEAVRPVRSLTDVQLEITHEGTRLPPIYAKVLPVQGTVANQMRLRFTSVAPEAEAVLSVLRAR